MTTFGKPPGKRRSAAGANRTAQTPQDARQAATGKRRSDASRPRGTGLGARHGRRSSSTAAQLPETGPAQSTLHSLAAQTQQQKGHTANRDGNEGNASAKQVAELAEADAAASALAAPSCMPRGRLFPHMHSSIAQLLGSHGQDSAWQQQPGSNEAVASPLHASLGAAYEQHGGDQSDRSHILHDDAGQGWPSSHVRQHHQPGMESSRDHQQEASDAAQPASDYSRRNMARLGGEGVAGIFGAGAGTQGSTRNRRTGAGGIYMSSLGDIKAGLSDSQRARQAAQREQLKRDLEEQMQQKKEAEARKKAELAELEEREDAKLRAYWAAQARGGGDKGSPPRAAAASVSAATGGRSEAQQQKQHQGGGSLGATPMQPMQPRDRPGRLQAGLSATPEPLGAVAGGSRRGEALVQPGITVFLPPDKAAERRARQAIHLCSDNTEAVHPVAGTGDQRPAPTAWQADQQQQHPALPMLTPAQAVAILAAANPALASSGSALLYPYAMPPHLLPPATSAGPLAGGSVGVAASSEPQVLSLLRELQQEQQRMREQFSQQLEAVTRLSGDAVAARSERDRARQDLERVQRLLAERQAATAAPPVGSSLAAARLASTPLAASSSEADLMGVTTHVLPLGAHRIPSRLGTPATSARAPPQQQGIEAADMNLPARYRKEKVEPWQQHKGSGAAAGPSKQPAAAGMVGGRHWHAGPAVSRPAAGGQRAPNKGRRV